MNGAELARHVAARWPEVGIILASGRPRPNALPPRKRFHEKPYTPSDVLRTGAIEIGGSFRPLLPPEATADQPRENKTASVENSGSII
jgi:hypothetical protein